jgi:hypothetical protein
MQPGGSRPGGPQREPEALGPKGRKVQVDVIKAVPKEKRVRESNFSMLVNTGKRVDHLPAAQRKMLEEAWETICIQYGENILEFMNILLPGDSFDDPVKFPAMPAVSFKPEVGKKLGKLHSHFIIRYHHNSAVQIDLPATRRFFNEAVGDKCHVEVRAFRDDGELAKIREYLLKD